MHDNDQERTHQLENFWPLTQEQRQETKQKLHAIGLEDFHFPSEALSANMKHPEIVVQEEEKYISQKLAEMHSPFTKHYPGFFYLNIATALDNEQAIESALRQEIGESVSFRQMSAFKSNHNLPLQYARLKSKENAGLEVASLHEAAEAIALGFLPENIVFANPTMNEREFLGAYHLGVTAFCFDHLQKLTRMIGFCQKHHLDSSRLRLIIRLATPFGGAGVSMGRFGIDVLKNPRMIQAIYEQAKVANIPIVGVSFHVGLGAKFFAAYDNIFMAIEQAFQMSHSILGCYPDIVNIGGGFDMSETGLRYLGTLQIDEQIKRLGIGLRQLRVRFHHNFAVWSEIGQGYVGNAGSAFIRVEHQEMRENPDRQLKISVPLPGGSVLWSHRYKTIYAEQEQRIVTNGGNWNFGILRHLTLYPEVWVVNENGHSEQLPQSEYVIPTLVYGRSCDSTDVLNPKVNGEWLRLMLPDLDKYSQETIVLRLGLSAYMDNSGDFNWQGAKLLPTFHNLALPKSIASRFPRNYLARINQTSRIEYRHRPFSRQALTARQIQEAKSLVAEQFSEREQMISWLRQNTRYGERLTRETLDDVFGRLVEEYIDSGLSMVTLKVASDQLDEMGEIVSVCCIKVIQEDDIPKVPLQLSAIWDRHVLRLVFETEAMVIRRLHHATRHFKEPIFPMAYGAMGAKKEGEPSYAELLHHAMQRIQGSNEIKSLGVIATGEQSIALVDQNPEFQHVIHVPYDRISYCGERPFEGIQFQQKPGELRFYVSDLSGPYRQVEPLPHSEALSVEIKEGSFLG